MPGAIHSAALSHPSVIFDLGAADESSLTAGSLHRRGPSKGVTFYGVVSLPGCGTHLDWYYTLHAFVAC